MNPLEPLTRQEVAEFQTSSPTEWVNRSAAVRAAALKATICRSSPLRVLRSVHRLAQLAQRPVDATLDRGERLSGQLGDLRDGQLGAEAQRDRLTLLLAQQSQALADEVAIGDPLQISRWAPRSVRSLCARAPAPRWPVAGHGRAGS